MRGQLTSEERKVLTFSGTPKRLKPRLHSSRPHSSRAVFSPLQSHDWIESGASQYRHQHGTAQARTDGYPRCAPIYDRSPEILGPLTHKIARAKHNGCRLIFQFAATKRIFGPIRAPGLWIRRCGPALKQELVSRQGSANSPSSRNFVHLSERIAFSKCRTSVTVWLELL